MINNEINNKIDRTFSPLKMKGVETYSHLFHDTQQQVEDFFVPDRCYNSGCVTKTLLTCYSRNKVYTYKFSYICRSCTKFDKLIQIFYWFDIN